MSIPLHNTVMGQRLIEGTLPDIARELKNLNAHLNRIAEAFDKAPTPTAPPPQPEAEADVIDALRAAKGELVGLIEERYGDPDKWPTVRKVRAVLDRLTAEQNDSDDIPDAAFLRHARRRQSQTKADRTIARAMADLARNRLTEIANANPEEEGREL